MADQKPSIGRIVHYASYGTPGGEFLPSNRAAIVTELDPDSADGMGVGLCVLNPTGQYFNRNVAYDGSENPKSGTWHWPPRV